LPLQDSDVGDRVARPVRSSIPLLLTALRALLAPVMLVLAWFNPRPPAFAVCLILAFLSDVFDGILARRLNVATPVLRRLDSIADSVFYVAALFAAWYLHPSELREYLPALVVLGAVEAVRYAFDLWKFRREAAYHLWSSKLWGICLFVGFYSLLVLGRGGLFVAVPIYAGVLVDLEGLAVSLVLREWKSDVPSIVHAWRLSRGRGGIDLERSNEGR
jgi:CDP-diacylglycerol--glycerol-3-phosphate 3-phosphatidyltransferase